METFETRTDDPGLIPPAGPPESFDLTDPAARPPARVDDSDGRPPGQFARCPAVTTTTDQAAIVSKCGSVAPSSEHRPGSPVAGKQVAPHPTAAPVVPITSIERRHRHDAAAAPPERRAAASGETES